MSIVKLEVCKSCLSPNIVNPNCVCVYQRGHPTVELEFERCDHCHTIEDYPIENDYNTQKLKVNEIKTDLV